MERSPGNPAPGEVPVVSLSDEVYFATTHGALVTLATTDGVSVVEGIDTGSWPLLVGPGVDGFREFMVSLNGALTDGKLLRSAAVFTDSVTGAPAASAYVVGVQKPSIDCDMNGDGMAHILWRNAVTGVLSYWQMNGTMMTSREDLAVVSYMNWQIAL